MSGDGPTEKLRAAAQAVLDNADRPGSRMCFMNDGIDVWVDYQEVDQSALDDLATALKEETITDGP